ncbi:MAG: hypothetical protein ACYCQJ_07040 [Nitrososphaerales archaeon]
MKKTRKTTLVGLAILSLVLFSSLVMIIAPAESSAISNYNNVQVLVETQTQGLGLYTLTAYNSSGSLISSSQSNYPAFSLELPNGIYLLSVTAVNTSYYWGYSTLEYGYELAHVNGPANLVLTTNPLSSITSSKISVQANFVNGTALSGAQISSSILGLMYWWPYNEPYANTFDLWNQTNSDGVATLTVPSVPVLVYAWDSVYVNLPRNQTTVVRNIGGENVNVTVYWQPMYLGLSGSTLVIPPSSSGKITLHAEQTQQYWYPLYTMGSAKVMNAPGIYSTATISGSPVMTPSSVYNQQQQMQSSGMSGIAPLGSSQGSPTTGTLPPTQIPTIVPVTQDSSSLSTTDLILAISAIGALVLASATFLLVARK